MPHSFDDHPATVDAPLTARDLLETLGQAAALVSLVYGTATIAWRLMA